jgi:hypothetical protein
MKLLLLDVNIINVHDEIGQVCNLATKFYPVLKKLAAHNQKQFGQ